MWRVRKVIPLLVSVLVATKKYPSAIRLEMRSRYPVAAVAHSLPSLFRIEGSNLQAAKGQLSATIGHL